MNDTQTKLISDIETMLPLYRGKNIKEIETPVQNVDWNIRKLRDGTLEPSAWVNYTKGDFSAIAAALKEGESGQSFAVAAGARMDAAFQEATGSDNTPPEAVAVGSEAAEATSTAMPGEPGEINIHAFLSDKAAQHREKLQWETSVVDLLKLVGVDSSLAERKRLAAVCGMSEGEVRSVGSEEGNAALHAILLKTLATNQGQLPAAVV